MKQPAVYIMANKRNGTLYKRVTTYLVQRVYQHKNGIFGGFTHRYGCKKLVYYELLSQMEMAIFREKQIKNFSRKKKLKLIESINPEWNDLYESLIA